MLKCLMVGLGGAVGSMGRYLIGLAMASVSERFPFSTLLINAVGALLIGGITAFSEQVTPLPAPLLLLLTTGVCGGFTTFSTFSLETMRLLDRGRLGSAALYAGASVLLCLAGIWLGRIAVRTLFVR